MTVQEYAVKLTAQVSDFERKMDSAHGKMEKVKGTGSKMSMRISSALRSIKSPAHEFETNMDKVEKKTKKSTNAMSQSFNKLKGVIAGALSIAAVIKFGKEAVDAGAKLNAMTAMSNKAFGSMSGEVQEWAKSASKSYGLSQRMALQYTSTLGSMAHAFGFSTKESVDMAETIAARVGDVASYFSIGQDEAYNKMTAIFTGETEALKSLGIVMTQSALDQFALANGFGKTTSQMTEQEKVMLRYKFLLQQTSLAEGDFVDSSARGSWGNQIRQLKLQVEDFKASIGQGLIIALTPAIKLLNQFMSKLVSVANVFSDFMAKISGKSTKSVASITPAVADVGTSVAEAGDKAANTAKKVAKTAKEATRTVMSFDQLHTLNAEKDSSDTTADTGTTGTDGLAQDIQKTSEAAADTGSALDKIKSKLAPILKYARELGSIFKKGFFDGLGGQNLDGIKANLASIGKSIKDILTDPNVVGAADNMVKSWTRALGQIAGSVASIGITIGNNLTGGIAKYLEQNSGRIKKHLTDQFNISAEVAKMTGDFAQAFANIFSAFGGENGQQFTANLIGIFADTFMGITDLAARVGRDIVDLLTRPIIDNQEGLKTALDGTLGLMAEQLGTLKGLIDNTFDSLIKMYDEHIHPLFDSITTGVSDIVGHATDAYNTYILPVLESLQTKWDTVVKEHLQPLLDNVIGLIGDIADLVKTIWENVIQPFITWLIDTLAPILAPVIKFVGEVVMDACAVIWDAINTVVTIARDIIKFFTDVFKGDWKAVWEDVKKIVKDIIEGIHKTITGTLAVIQKVISGVWTAIKTVTSTVWNGIKSAVTTVMLALAAAIKSVINKIKEVVSNVWNAIKSTTEKVFNAIKSVVKTAWENIKYNITHPIEFAKNTVKNVVNGIKKLMSFTGLTTKIQNALSGVRDAICGPFERAWEYVSGIIEKIQNFSLSNMISGIGDFFTGGGGSVIDLTGYATGGFPEDGLFMANHNELVGGFSNGKSAVVNNGQIIEGIKGGVQDAIAPFMLELLGAIKQSGNGGGQEIVMDGEKVARLISRHQNRISAREYAVAR